MKKIDQKKLEEVLGGAGLATALPAGTNTRMVAKVLADMGMSLTAENVRGALATFGVHVDLQVAQSIADAAIAAE